MEFAIVIPSYKDPAGLWYTVAAANADLEPDFAPDDFEIIAVVDGPEDDEDGRVIAGMRQQGSCKIINSNTRTPQKNRHIGLLATEAPYVFFLDSHVIPSRGFFKRIVETAREKKAALVQAGHTFWKRSEFGTAYAYNMNWKDHFWATTAENVPKSKEPYQIALAGHGAMCVDRAQYLEVGGYWDALNGWGGEEPQLNLKFWMLGKPVWMEPRVYHWHYMPTKRDLRAKEADVNHVRNFLLVAYASGGQKYLDAVYHFFTQVANSAETLEEVMNRKPVDPFGEVHAAVPKEAKKERELICSGPFGGDLDKLRQYFVSENIPH